MTLGPLRDFDSFWRLFVASLPAGVTLDPSVARSVGEIREIGADGETTGYLWHELRGDELHVHALLLEPTFRGRGIGGRALEALFAEQAGRASVVELGVEPDNAPARRLYERLGFEYTGEREGFLLMRRRLP